MSKLSLFILLPFIISTNVFSELSPKQLKFSNLVSMTELIVSGEVIDATIDNDEKQITLISP